jgi:hypothetical protein
MSPVAGVPDKAVEAPSRPMASAPVALPAEKMATDYAASQLCNLEGAGDVPFGPGELPLTSAAPVLFHGWVGVEGKKAVPAEAAVRFEMLEDKSRVWEVSIPVDQQREDVAASYSAPDLKNAGFASPIDLSGLPAGKYHLVVTYAYNDKHYICDNGRAISLNL